MEEEHEDYEESPIKRIIKRTVLLLLGVFLIVLMISYFVFGGTMRPIVMSYFISFSLDDEFSAALPNARVIFDAGAYEELKQIYFKEQKNEFKVCLQGEKRGNDYYVTGLKVPKMFSQSFNRVVSEFCDEGTIIPLHSHPRLSCGFSQQDIRSYEQFLSINPDAIIGLMCETNKFNFYGY